MGPVYFSTSDRRYAAVPIDGGYRFNYTTNTFGHPVLSGSFFMPLDEAQIFIRNALDARKGAK